jgi:hypothetical protein
MQSSNRSIGLGFLIGDLHWEAKDVLEILAIRYGLDRTRLLVRCGALAIYCIYSYTVAGYALLNKCRARWALRRWALIRGFRIISHSGFPRSI